MKQLMGGLIAGLMLVVAAGVAEADWPVETVVHEQINLLIVTDTYLDGHQVPGARDDLERLKPVWDAEVAQNLTADAMAKKLAEIGARCNQSSHVQIYYSGHGDRRALSWVSADKKPFALRDIAKALKTCSSVYLIWDADAGVDISALTEKLHPNMTIVFAGQPGHQVIANTTGFSGLSVIIKQQMQLHPSRQDNGKSNQLPSADQLLRASLFSILQFAESEIENQLPWVYRTKN